MSETPLLAARALQVTTPARALCTGLELSLRPGERWGLLGRNGAGKSTLLHTLAGLRPAQAGSLLLDGIPLAALAPRTRAQRIGLLPQVHEDAFAGSVLETALIGRHPHLGPWGWETERDIELARTALAAVGLGGFESRRIASLSGGERRRLGFASLLTQDPALYLLDEPSNHLDIHYQHVLLGLLKQRIASGARAWLMVSHDPTLAARYCNRIVLLHADGHTETGGTELLTATALSALYGHPLHRLESPFGPLFVPG